MYAIVHIIQLVSRCIFICGAAPLLTALAPYLFKDGPGYRYKSIKIYKNSAIFSQHLYLKLSLSHLGSINITIVVRLSTGVAALIFIGTLAFGQL